MAEFKYPMHIKDIKYINMNVNKMDFKDNSFDCVVDTFGLEYNINPGQALAEMQRVLKPGGKLLLINTGQINQHGD